MIETARLTVSDLDGLPDDDGRRYELIDGALHVSTQPHLEHQVVVDTLCGILRAWNRQSGIGGLAVSAARIVFDADEAMTPDVAWLSRERLLAARHPNGMLHGPPDLAVEVLSPGAKHEARDVKLKPVRYARWGVRAYWLVDPLTRTIDLFRLDGSSFRHSVTVGAGETLIAPILPSFVCPVNDVFADLPV